AELVSSIADGKFVPYSAITIVQNTVGGNFDKIDVRRVVAAAAPRARVRFATLPHCTSEIWARLEQTYTSVERALRMSETEIAAKLDVDIWSATAGLNDLKTWAEAADRELATHLEYRGTPDLQSLLANIAPTVAEAASATQ
ncbi:MAG: hypothetical protein KGQ28_09375, partial [Hyphomicrobiales bacterium]|nr:hypothetical protein [Hyphomicrobiales bacterium]